MADKVISAIKIAASEIYLYVLAVGTAALLALFIIYAVLSARKTGFDLKKRSAFFCTAFCLAFLFNALSLLGGGEKGLAALGFFVAAVTSSVIFTIPVKKEEEPSDGREFARFLDSRIPRPHEKDTERLTCAPQEKRAKEEGAELDFSHVKNVISRLDYFSLSQGDRRQIHELEAYLNEAERGADDKELKSKINDGLSSLLKIMSKYGA